jgi:ribosomal protein S18 acetylase RimI-like enzyme
MQNDEIMYRSICEDDFTELKALHEDFFPIKYNDSFYIDSCKEIGMNGGHLETIIAVSKNSGLIIGFLLGQFFIIDDCDDKDIIHINPNVKELLYILTLGLKDEYRRLGLATILINKLLEIGKQKKSCGAVYLHVIDYNKAALKFYEKNKFEFFREIPSFYIIDKKYYTSLLYIYYINGNGAPILHRLLKSVQNKAGSSIRFLFSIVESIIPQFLLNKFRINEENIVNTPNNNESLINNNNELNTNEINV